jgi:ABC-2 type transport system ATP-binding protein
MIEIKAITKKFGPVVALDSVSFKVQEGEVLGFLGPNGAGKTTTMKLISGFWQADQGQITINGIDVVKQAELSKRKIGYLPENVPLYDEMKVFEYLRFIAEIRDLAPDKVLTRIKEVSEICGLNSVIGKSLDELSKGFRQRVGLAQAIMHNPDVLILDEPTTGLDPNQIAEIRELIKKIGREKTVIFSTHILAEAQATCDRVIIINQGKIVAEGSPDQLMAKFQTQDEIIMTIKGPKSLISSSLNDLPAVSTVTIDEERSSDYAVYRIISKNGDLSLALSQLCLDQGWLILEMSRKRASLEDVFRDLTK